MLILLHSACTWAGAASGLTFQPLNTVTALLSGADLANIFAPSIITWQSPSLSISARMPRPA